MRDFFFTIIAASSPSLAKITAQILTGLVLAQPESNLHIKTRLGCDLSSNFQQACVNICHPQPSATCILNIALPTCDGCDKF